MGDVSLRIMKQLKTLPSLDEGVDPFRIPFNNHIKDIRGHGNVAK